MLICNIYREIGKIAAIREIGDSTRDSNQPFAVAGCYYNISMAQHPLQPFRIIDGTTLRKS